MKRLIVCLDGTWNTPDDGDNPTNVVKLMRALLPCDDKDVPQIAFYDKGVGTGGPIDRMWGGAFGRGLNDNILDGYRFLAHNYEANDEIYLFGFSRGAFTARSLAGFIHWMGLLEKDVLDDLTDAWNTYRNPQKYKERYDELLQHSRTNIPIKCIGVWDTVGALGVPIKFANILTRHNYKFHNTNYGNHIEYAFHALAIDEKRGPFKPTLWECNIDKNIPTERLQQVWFAGCHSNIGGSYPDARLSDIALDWMLSCVEKATGLAFDNEYRKGKIKPDHTGTLYNSLGGYLYSRLFPLYRVIGNMPIVCSWLSRQLRRFYRPGPGNKYINEMIHRSVVERWKKGGLIYSKGNAPFPYKVRNLEHVIRKLPIVEKDGSITDHEQAIHDDESKLRNGNASTKIDEISKP
ncbi:MAG: DUF2235 domain-containing protein [bacterium]